MNIHHFVFSQPSFYYGDPPSFVDFFYANDDECAAQKKFEEFSNGIDYDNRWIYETHMEERVAKDAAHFAYYNQDVAEEADNLMVAVLTKQPAIADTTLIFEACQYSTPETLRLLLKLLPDEQISPRCLLQTVIHKNCVNTCILINSGRVKDDGHSLSAACETGQRDIFDMILPISNPEFAVHFNPRQNIHWLDEKIAQRQKERLNGVVVDGTASRTRKI